MAESTYELIGRIINPGPRSEAAAPPRRNPAPAEPLEVLLGRVIGAPEPPLRVEPLSPEPVEAPAIEA